VNFSTGMGMNQKHGGPTLLATPRLTEQAKKQPAAPHPPQSSGTMVWLPRSPPSRTSGPTPGPPYPWQSKVRSQCKPRSMGRPGHRGGTGAKLRGHRPAERRS
jgi:hypothetical protein